MKKIRCNLNKDKVTSVNLYFQDESRFGLIAKQKRVITAKVITPIGKYKHSYLYKLLEGSFSLITGESFCMTTEGFCNNFFIKHLEDFSKHKPEELKILISDNAAFHSTKDIVLPENIVLMSILPYYCPELNPAEKDWQWMKDKITVKIYDTLDILENKMDDLINA